MKIFLDKPKIFFPYIGAIWGDLGDLKLAYNSSQLIFELWLHWKLKNENIEHKEVQRFVEIDSES